MAWSTKIKSSIHSKPISYTGESYNQYDQLYNIPNSAGCGLTGAGEHPFEACWDCQLVFNV
jgi:hypothetical protein